MTPIFIKVTGTPSEEADRHIPGFYCVNVNDRVPDDRIVTAAKDVFHANVAIECLDDFEIVFFDADGIEAVEPDDACGGSLAWEKGGDFFFIEERDFPAPNGE